jgi:hypothetical protein
MTHLPDNLASLDLVPGEIFVPLSQLQSSFVTLYAIFCLPRPNPLFSQDDEYVSASTDFAAHPLLAAIEIRGALPGVYPFGASPSIAVNEVFNKKTGSEPLQPSANRSLGESELGETHPLQFVQLRLTLVLAEFRPEQLAVIVLTSDIKKICPGVKTVPEGIVLS